MEGSVTDASEAERRGILQEISVADSVIDSRQNVDHLGNGWDLGLLRRRTLRPRPRLTYADLSPVSRRAPSPQLPSGSFTFEPDEPRERAAVSQGGRQSCLAYETPPKTPRSGQKSPARRPTESPCYTTELPFAIHIDSPDDPPAAQDEGPAPAKRPRMLSLGDQASLGQQLASLSNEQVVEVMERLVDKYPDIQQEVLELLPEPDLTHCQDRLSELLHNIYRALPRTRLASTRSALSYRQVKVHLLEFKKYCVQQGRHLLSCRAWTSLVNYVLLAWQLVNHLPIWENPSHNKIRAQCLRSLVMFCSKALKSADLHDEKMLELRPRLVKACRLNVMLEPCLSILNNKDQL